MRYHLLTLTLTTGLSSAFTKTSFLPQKQTQTTNHHAKPQPQSKLHMSNPNPMEPVSTNLLNSLNSILGLQSTDYTASYLNGGNAWECPATGTRGTAEWYSEVSPKYLTGASVTSQTSAGGSEYGLNVWMGPSYDVPNMLLSFGASVDGMCFVIADYVPRGATPLGSDMQYMQAYYGPDSAAAAWEGAASIEGVFAVPPDMSFDTRMLYSPARIAVAGLSAADAERIATEHVQRFLGWVQSAQPIPARSRGSFNMRDDKLRQFFYKGEVKKNCAAFGPDVGMTVAAVNTGPIAEAYVGGGS